MQKMSLRANNHTETTVHMPLRMLNISSWVFFILFTFACTILPIFISKALDENIFIEDLIRVIKDKIALVILLVNTLAFLLPIIAVILYFALLTIRFMFICESKKRPVQFRFIQWIKMPSCVCAEALKPHQMIRTYLCTILIVVFLLTVFSILDINVAITAFIVAIPMAPDAALMIFLLYIKRRYKPEYISVEDHLFSITLWNIKMKDRIKNN